MTLFTKLLSYEPNYLGSIFLLINRFSSCPSLCQLNEKKEYYSNSKTEDYLQNFKSRKGIPYAALNYLPKGHSFVEIMNGDALRHKIFMHKNMKELSLIYDQRYIDERVQILGYDLAAAHFILSRGGKVRFRGHKSFFETYTEDDQNLPCRFDAKFLLEEINASSLPIIYDGLWNIDDLAHLKILNLSRCPRIDDWCLDRIGGQFSETLEELDISYCPLVTEKGLEIITRLRKLKRLNLSGLDHIPNVKLICLLLEESMPGLAIEGISYS